jgi:hypothetical protein
MEWFRERWEVISSAVTPQRLGVVVVLATLFTTAVKWWNEITGFLLGRGLSAMETVPSILVGLLVIMGALFWFTLEYAVRKNRLLRPKIRLSFEPDGLGIVLARERVTFRGAASGTVNVVEFRATYVRLRADALSKTTVKGCSAFLVGLEKKIEGSKNFVTIKLPQSIPVGPPQFDVFPGVPATIDFLRVNESDKKPMPPREWPLVLDDAFQEHGTYRFTFIVNGGDVPEKYRVDIKWDGKWNGLTGRQVTK